MADSMETEFPSLDGTMLRGTVVLPAGPLAGGLVLVHGGGVTREEGGFFARIADVAVAARFASLRFDFRGHGTSGGRQEDLTDLQVPTLIVHGTADTFIPVESSREHIERIPAESCLIEIEGAQHGIAVHDDPEYLDPQTQRWQAEGIVNIIDWVVSRHPSSSPP